MIKCHLARLLGERRMHIRELSREAEISYMTLWNLYHEKTARIDFNTIDKICESLGIGVGDLFEYVPDQPKSKKGGK